MPAISTNELKNGVTLELDKGLFNVVEFQHVKPGKGGAFVRTKLRNMRTGSVIDGSDPKMVGVGMSVGRQDPGDNNRTQVVPQPLRVGQGAQRVHVDPDRQIDLPPERREDHPHRGGLSSDARCTEIPGSTANPRNQQQEPCSACDQAW